MRDIDVNEIVRKHKKNKEQVFTLVVCSVCHKQISGIYSYENDEQGKEKAYCKNCSPNRDYFVRELQSKEAVILRKQNNKAFNVDPEDEIKKLPKDKLEELSRLKTMNPQEYKDYSAQNNIKIQTTL